MQQQLPALTFCWQQKRLSHPKGSLPKRCSAEANCVPSLLLPSARRRAQSIWNAAWLLTAFKHRDYSSHHPILQPDFSNDCYLLFSTSIQCESNEDLLASASSLWLYQLARVWMHASCFLMVKSAFCHSLSWDSCACLDLKNLTLQNCIHANCLFQNFTGIDALTLL